MNEKEKFYITTPIYYPSSKLTLGNCYTTIVCDALARFNRMLGKDVFYLTGTDEHGQKIQKKAEEAGKTEMEFINEIVSETKDLWKKLDITYDKFIRTTDAQHESAVKKIFNQLYEQGDIYKSYYSGLYCTPCEAFWTEEQLVDGKCPDCGRPVAPANEEAYFFRLGKYADRVQKLLEEDSEFLVPKSRVNEMINNFIKPGLADLCVTRKTVKWGIPVDFDPEQTIYVWLDALNNYITALGYNSDDDTNYRKYWPADVHIVGKEIVRFHAIIWPAILMALNLPVPKKIMAHGWILFGGDKLSKSKEVDAIDCFDPRILLSRYGNDSIRYYLLREIPFGSDGNYSQDLFLNSFNNALCNEMGNLISRTLGMLDKYNNGIIHTVTELTDLDREFQKFVLDKKESIISNVIKIKPTEAITEVFDIFRRSNKYIDENEPWILAKDPNNKDRLNSVLCNLSEAIIIGCTLALPFLPEKTPLAFAGFNVPVPTSFDSIGSFGFLPEGLQTHKNENLYPRLDINLENEELHKITASQKQ